MIGVNKRKALCLCLKVKVSSHNQQNEQEATPINWGRGEVRSG